MDDNTIERIISTIKNIEFIGASPAVSFNIFELVNKSTTQIEDIVCAIQREPSISVQLLKLSNSAYYSRGIKIKTLSQAIVHLGLDTVKKLVMSIEMIGLFRNNEDFWYFDERLFWKSSLAGALICRDLAKRLRLNDLDTPFVCGLLRDFGVLVLRQYFPDLFKQIFDECSEKKKSFSFVCNSVCGLDHRFISYLLFMRWNLPMNITSVFNEKALLRDFNLIIHKMLHKVDETLKTNKYGQWDIHSNSDMVDSDLFSFDLADYIKSVQQCIQETDELAQSFHV